MKINITRLKHLEEILASLGILFFLILAVLSFFLGKVLFQDTREREDFLPNTSPSTGVYMLQEAQDALKRP